MPNTCQVQVCCGAVSSPVRGPLDLPVGNPVRKLVDSQTHPHGEGVFGLFCFFFCLLPLAFCPLPRLAALPHQHPAAGRGADLTRPRATECRLRH